MNMAETLQFNGLRGQLKPDESMSRHVSWRCGGAADRFYVPADLDDLASFLRQLPAEEPLLFVGLGSNLLVRDGGWRGTVVMTHAASHRPRMEAGLIYADAGVASPKVARFAAMHDLEGGEFLAGVPGCVGGALAMNAGCYGGETWNHVIAVETVDCSGVLRHRVPADYELGYRHVQLKGGADEWFVSGVFGFQPGDESASMQRIKELLQKRVATQPLNEPNAGSVFRNPPGDHAARLIESCGLKGFRVGGAEVSRKHANFIVNLAEAAARDIETVIDHVEETVHARTGVRLIREVRIVGETA